jgi:hypothetical protein
MKLANYRIWLLVLVAGCLTLPAAGEMFTLTLKNGNTFVTYYQPQEADWDPNQILLLTDFGNLIALDKDDVLEAVSDTETRGIGRFIDSTTIELGASPNDLPIPTEDAEAAAMDALQQAVLQQQLQPRPNYSQQQFVEPGQTGGGIPVGLVGIQ